MEHPQITGTWRHSHEEDAASRMVFRPDSFHFPPSRGRLGFTLQADGTADYLGYQPADLGDSDPATWDLSSGDELTITAEGKPVLRAKLVSASPEKLVLEMD